MSIGPITKTQEYKSCEACAYNRDEKALKEVTDQGKPFKAMVDVKVCTHPYSKNKELTEDEVTPTWCPFLNPGEETKAYFLDSLNGDPI